MIWKDIVTQISRYIKMGNKESNESAAVKRQAEGFSNPMYRMLDLGVSLTRAWLVCLELPIRSVSGRRTVPGALQEGHDDWQHGRAGRGHQIKSEQGYDCF